MWRSSRAAGKCASILDGPSLAGDLALSATTAVLKSVSGFEMYCKRYGRITLDRIVEFLLLDNEFPRAARYCIGLANQSLHAITGTPAGGFSCACEQRRGPVALRAEYVFAKAHPDLQSLSGNPRFVALIRRHIKLNAPQ